MNGEWKEELPRMRRHIDQEIGRRAALMKEHLKVGGALEKSTEYFENANMARSVVQSVAEATQKHIEFHISSIVTMALQSVFPDPYTFELRFLQRRNKTEADLIFIKNGNETDDLLNAGGGGPADIASFALRIALWSIKKTQPVQILDEPMRFVSRDLQTKVSMLMKELSDKLGVQFIVVSHIPELCGEAHNIIKIENSGGESKILLER